jgi:D-aminopeptidase
MLCIQWSSAREYGLIETPIILTNTLSMGTAYNALVRYVHDTYLGNRIRWFNPVVGVRVFDVYTNHDIC